MIYKPAAHTPKVKVKEIKTIDKIIYRNKSKNNPNRNASYLGTTRFEQNNLVF